MSKQKDPRPLLRDHLRSVIEAQETTIKAEAHKMGLHEDTIYRILHGLTIAPGKATMEAIAGYLEIPFNAVQNWFHRDHQRLRGTARYGRAIEVVDLSDPTPTFWGIVQDADFDRGTQLNCKTCSQEQECRRRVALDLPIACEVFIEKDLVPEHHLALEASYA